MGEIPQGNILGDENKLKYLEIRVGISSVDTETLYRNN